MDKTIDNLHSHRQDTSSAVTLQESHFSSVLFDIYAGCETAMQTLCMHMSAIRPDLHCLHMCQLLRFKVAVCF